MIVVVEVAVVADIAVVDVAVVAAFCSRYNTASLLILNPFRTAAHFWGQTTQFPSRLSPTRDSGYRGVNPL